MEPREQLRGGCERRDAVLVEHTSAAHVADSLLERVEHLHGPLGSGLREHLERAVAHPFEASERLLRWRRRHAAISMTETEVIRLD